MVLSLPEKEKMCTIEAKIGTTIYYRFIVDGVERFDPELPFKLKGTQMYNYIVAPKEKIAQDLLNMDINQLDEYEKQLYQAEFEKLNNDPTYFDDIDEGEGPLQKINQFNEKNRINNTQKVTIKHNVPIQHTTHEKSEKLYKPISNTSAKAPAKLKYTVASFSEVNIITRPKIAGVHNQISIGIQLLGKHEYISDFTIRKPEKVKTIKREHHTLSRYYDEYSEKTKKLVISSNAAAVQRRDLIELSNQIAVYLKTIGALNSEINMLKEMSRIRQNSTPSSPYNFHLSTTSEAISNSSRANARKYLNEPTVEKLKLQIDKICFDNSEYKRRIAHSINKFLDVTEQIMNVSC